jgi:hypothetical protein
MADPSFGRELLFDGGADSFCTVRHTLPLSLRLPLPLPLTLTPTSTPTPNPNP